MKNKNKAILCIIASAFCFCWMSIFVRLSGDLPSVQKSFFRNVVAVLVSAVVLWRSGDGLHFQKKTLPLLVGRSVCGTMGILCNFYAVDNLLLSNASMLNKMAPFFTLLFSFLILKENLNLLQLGVVVTAFIGSLCVIKPVPGNMELVPSLIGFAGGMSAGMAYTFVRAASLKGEKGPRIVFFFSAFSTLILMPFAIIYGKPMSFTQVLTLIGAGVAATGGQFGVTAAYTYAPAREVSVFDYSQVLFAALFGLILFNDHPDVWSFVGYALIIGAAAVLFLYNNRKKA